MEVLLSLLYTIIFVTIIYYSRFYKASGIGFRLITMIYLMKISAGILLNFLYGHYYPHKETSDIYKFFYDSKPIYDALRHNPVKFLQLITGINDNANSLKIYTSNTANWLNPTKEYLKYSGMSDNDFFESHRLITRFNAVVRILSFGYLTVHVVFINFISLTGQVMIFRTFYPWLHNRKFSLIAAVFLIPSVLLWGSGILKEGLVIFGIGLFVWQVFRFESKFTFKNALLIILSVIIICISKYYVLVALAPAIAAYLIVRFTGNKFIFFKYLSITLIFAFLLFLPGLFSNRYNLIKVLADKQSDLIRNSKGGSYYVRYAGISSKVVYFSSGSEVHGKIIDPVKKYLILPAGLPYNLADNDGNGLFYTNDDRSYYCLLYSSERSGSYFEIPKIRPGIIDLIKDIPAAFFNIFFRPFRFQRRSFLPLIASIENILILLVIIYFSAHGFRINSSMNTGLFCLTFALISYLIIGLTTPVEGAMVRYKILFLPFLITGLLLINGKNDIINKSNIKNQIP